MLDLQQYEQPMAHQRDIHDHVESCAQVALKIDDGDGIAAALNFRPSMLSKVDYCLLDHEQVELIELTDLSTTVERWQSHLSEWSKLSRKEKREIRRKIWGEASHELRLKWQGSIAIVERLWRVQGFTADANYRMRLVCKNNVDARMLDEIETQLKVFLSGSHIQLTVLRSDKCV